MTIQGLHHITLVCSNAQQPVNFYTQVLGQRLVKKTVNFDDPSGYHLIATAGPGFLFDEDVDKLGQSLKLPPWLEARRPEIERRLRPIPATPWRAWEVA